MHRSIKQFIFFLLLISSFSVSARYATYEEAPVEVNLNNVTIDVKKSGKYSEVHEKEITILNEVGRQKYGSQTLYFMKDITEIVDIEAKTIYEGKEYPVDKSHIEIKPLASSEHGFDQKYQILISFPHVLIGSKLYLKYKKKCLIPPMDNAYYEEVRLGIDQYSKTADIKIVSELNLKTLINDPDKNLSVKEDIKDNKYYISVTQNKPIYYALSNESYSKTLDEQKTSYISISSVKSYDEISKYFAPKYKEVSEQKLPTLFQTIVDQASKIKNEIEQIDYITSELSEKIRYMGEWRTIKGQFFPRDLEIVASTGFGDCKDYSTVTVAILKKLGYKANNAFVYRGINYIQNNNILPSEAVFNHAILTTIGKSGTKYWIDPTNFISMAGKAYPDISGRSSLVLDSENPRYEYIPGVDSKKSGFSLSEEIRLSDGYIDSTNSLSIFGERASSLTGVELYTSRQAIEEMIIRYFSGETKPLEQHVVLPNLKSRIVQDINVDFSYKKEDDLIRSNIEKAIKLPFLSLEFAKEFIKFSEDDVGVSYLMDPINYNYKTVIKNYTAETPEKLNFDMKNKWFSASRKCYKAGTDIIIEEKAELFNPIIYPEDTKTDSFKEIKKQIKNNMMDSILIGKRIREVVDKH